MDSTVEQRVLRFCAWSEPYGVRLDTTVEQDRSLNWNQTQLDGRAPVTLHTADRVGAVLRHLAPNERPQGRYAFHM